MDNYVSEKSLIIYVTVGRPNSSIPLRNRVSALVWLGEDTPIQMAKKIRKMVADGNPKEKPSSLYWAIFAQGFDAEPVLSSDNFPGVYDEKNNPQGILVNIG